MYYLSSEYHPNFAFKLTGNGSEFRFCGSGEREDLY